MEELIDAKSGHAKRYRNVGSPLALAFYRGALKAKDDNPNGITAEDRYSAGTRFQRLWEAREQIATSSFERIGGGDDPHWWTEKIAEASESVRRLQDKMYPKNFVIVQRFCGEGYTMAQALRGVVEAHPNAVPIRVREALDELVTAMTGRR